MMIISVYIMYIIIYCGEINISSDIQYVSENELYIAVLSENLVEYSISGLNEI